MPPAVTGFFCARLRSLTGFGCELRLLYRRFLTRRQIGGDPDQIGFVL
jgi:hypothetical protein